MDAVAVTGGNGELGRAVLARLSDRGYGTVNLNRGKRREDVADAYLTILEDGTYSREATRTAEFATGSREPDQHEKSGDGARVSARAVAAGPALT